MLYPLIMLASYQVQIRMDSTLIVSLHAKFNTRNLAKISSLVHHRELLIAALMTAELIAAISLIVDSGKGIFDRGIGARGQCWSGV